MPSLTVENYLKSALTLQIQSGEETVSTGQIAQALGVTPGTVTSMFKTLSESGLASYKPYAGVSLTKAGRTLAIRMLRRHRLIELFLVKTLNLRWDEVHDEAERMEHAVSDGLIDRIDEYLDHPEEDPHGDPIPTADGQLRKPVRSIALSTCQPPSRVRVVRVLNQQPEFLRYLTESGLELGVIARVEQNSSAAGIVTLRLGRKQVALSLPASENVLVEPTADDEES